MAQINPLYRVVDKIFSFEKIGETATQGEKRTELDLLIKKNNRKSSGKIRFERIPAWLLLMYSCLS